MAVTSQLTSIENFNSSPTLTDTGYGSGPGSGTNTDVFIEGSQSAGRRVDNTTDKGLGFTFTSIDMSAAEVHVKIWLWITQWPLVTQVQIRLQDGSGGTEDDHELPTAEYPALGGWFPIWIDVSRVAEVSGGADEADIVEMGVLVDIGNVGGTSDNVIIDEAMYGTSGLLWDGTGGDFGDFRTYEGTNNEGSLITANGVDFCYSRIEIGSATATGFTDSGFTLIFPDQSLVSSTFMGLTADLQHASTDINLSGAVIQSSNPTGATNRPDILVTGTSGVFDMDSMTISGMRTIELTSGCSLTNSTVSNSGVIDATFAGTNGADLSGTTVSASIVAADSSSVEWDVNADPNGELDNMTFAKGAAAHHAIEFGTNIPATITLTGHSYSGFNASDAQNDSTLYFADTSGTITVNISGGDTPSYKSAGATIDIVLATVDCDITVRDVTDASLLQNARVHIECATGGPFPFEESITAVQSAGTATVTHTAHGLATNDKVLIEGANEDDYNGVKTITVTDANTYTFTIDSGADSPATGTITSTLVIISGLTNASGFISDTRSYSSNQPITGRVRLYGAAGSRYKTGAITGTIDSVNGFAATVQLIPDE